MSNPTKLNSLFEVKTNVQTKQVVSQIRLKKKLLGDSGFINPDKHASHDINENLDPSTFINPSERKLPVKPSASLKSQLKTHEDDD